MKKSKYAWQLSEEAVNTVEIENWLKEKSLPSFLAPMLWNREIRTTEELTLFFEPSIEAIHDPYLMYDMEKAVVRIQEAIALGQRILIYGDYDADGITSTTVLKEAIEMVGGEVSFYLPDRFKDGYGPNKETYDRLISELGIELLITVDNGVAGHDAIAHANSLGVDVIVTDHHEIPATLPDAFAVVHPRHPEGHYPFGDLAGVGVAFKVATALLEEVPEEMLDLVAIGTIADLVSLTGENRALVQFGLKQIQSAQRIGLRALFEKIDNEQSTATEEAIGFGIAPRLNAIGRLGDASPGVRLLSTFDEDEAEQLADEIDAINVERQEIVKETVSEAMALLETKQDQGIYVLAKEGWHQGVLGIVASKIVQETGRPALVLGIDEETGIAKGSARSVEQVSLYDAMNAVSDLFTHFGGHHMAAGMSLERENLEKLEVGLNQYVSALNVDFSEGPPLAVEASLSLSEVGISQIQGLTLLAPFGTDNPAPYFLFENCATKDIKQIGADKTHLKFQLINETDQLDCIGFGFGSDSSDIATAENLEVVGQLAINEWNGHRKPQLFVKDFKVSGQQVFDCRSKVFNRVDFNEEETLFIVSTKKEYDHLKKNGTASIFLLGETTLDDVTKDWQMVVVVECPVKVLDLKEVLDQLNYSQLHLYLISKEQCYLNGMPNRDQFAALFKFIAQYSNVDIRYKLNDLSSFLKIDKNLLIFMIQVFFDLGFVTIENGIMSKVENPTQRKLEESLLFEERQQKIVSEKFLLYSSVSELQAWLS
ncbi:single-stranded-DNA-specific exonuclease RecJ [Vagococcus sp. PNs007]|uniref:Single-stranded-DNA-specific exonuclease RecJ n=1 Tax=Vagococcus proximus TaxID=2991417 RepID=A0ABT5WYP8_9ENTE|nr:single-stranded-DNA-specific exonuclease RecJ [Vagococcus proximus]MDF0478878.1 single-stranded-DNA-specific exonuclease RecJ [Vagococcus proximus]